MNEELAFSTEEHAPDTRRQPHLGYALALILIAVITSPLAFGLVWLVESRLHLIPSSALHHLKDYPGIAIYSNLIATVMTLLIAWPLFAWAWNRPFWKVVGWNREHVRGIGWKLAGLGLLTSVLAQLFEHLMTLPSNMPIDAFFRSQSVLWWVTLYGVVIAPIFEETLFRGFLLPAIAMAIDFFRKAPVPPEMQWENGISKTATAISAVITSIAFGCLHAAQLGYAWNAVALLSCVGLLLACVRLYFNSVAASATVHSAYNGSLFLAMFFATGGYQHLDKLTQR